MSNENVQFLLASSGAQDRFVCRVHRPHHQIRLRQTGDSDPVRAEADNEAVCLQLQLPAHVVRGPVELQLIARRGEAELCRRKKHGPRAGFGGIGALARRVHCAPDKVVEHAVD